MRGPRGISLVAARCGSGDARQEGHRTVVLRETCRVRDLPLQLISHVVRRAIPRGRGGAPAGDAAGENPLTS